MRFTEQYKNLNEQLHSDRADYGAGGHAWAKHVRDLAKMVGTVNVLDYGCGKGTLAKAVPELLIEQYDPAIPEHAAEPQPADVVVCTDVLEHVEPECVNAVLNHLQALTLKTALLMIDLGPAGKLLPDGRNAHICQRSQGWWIRRISTRFEITQLQYAHPKLFIVCRQLPKKP